jgi:type III pantothenate kinase
VSEPKSDLLIDIGNSRIKYAWVGNNDNALIVQVATDTNEILEMVKEANTLWLATVGQSETSQAILSVSPPSSTELINTRSSAFGLQCAYANPSTLGVDRWLGMLAVREITQLPFALISLGTATTVDFVSGNQHQGGWIAPGFSLMRDSIVQRTDKVFTNNHFPVELALGKSTEECVNMGCLASLKGLMQSVVEQISEHSNYVIYVTGGGASLVEPAFNQRLEFLDNPVILGLNRLRKAKSKVV